MTNNTKLIVIIMATMKISKDEQKSSNGYDHSKEQNNTGTFMCGFKLGIQYHDTTII